jgi:hypothetical protein
LERLSYLLTPRFFPGEDFIDELRDILDAAITNSILTKGRPSTDTAPLRYGEAVVMILPWTDGKTEQVGGLFDPAKGSKAIEFPVRNGKPLYPETLKASLRILSGDGSNKNAVILAGDQVRFELIDMGFFNGGMALTNNRSDAGRFTILHHDDNLRAPGRLGEYFQSSDRIAFQPAGATDKVLSMWSQRVSQRIIFVDTLEPGSSIQSTTTGFLLRRCAERDED